MVYKINGTELTLQPESGGWLDRPILNLDGNGHAVYPPNRSYEIRWGFMSPAEFDQIYTFFLSQGVTGTSVVDLPQWHVSTYTGSSYTGCVLQEPVYDSYDNSYFRDVRLVITNIRT